MATIRLIIETYGTVQVSEDHWRDGTTYRTLDIEVPTWLHEAMLTVPSNCSMRVVGAEPIK